MLNEEPFYERLRREDKARHEKEKRDTIDRRAKLTHASSHTKDGECLLNLLTFEDYAKVDEDAAKLVTEENNLKDDIDKLEKAHVRQDKIMQTSQANFHKLEEARKSLAGEARIRVLDHPKNQSQVYATIGVAEIQ